MLAAVACGAPGGPDNVVSVLPDDAVAVPTPIRPAAEPTQAVDRVFDLTNDSEFLGRVYEGLAAHCRWLGEYRCPDRDGLIVPISPFESGMDNTLAYDPALGIQGSQPGWWAVRLRVAGLHVSHLLRSGNYDLARIYRLGRFNVKDVAVNCVYAEALRVLSRIAGEVGRTQDAEDWHTDAERVEMTIIENLYDEAVGAFFPTYGPERRTSRVLTVASLFPLLLESLPRRMAEELVSRHVTNGKEFWTKYPLPTVAIPEPSFDADPGEDKHPLIWRGPSWINTNWFVARGLRRHGYETLAGRLERGSVELVERSGFREFYHPHTGAGQGARDFGWSTLVVDMA